MSNADPDADLDLMDRDALLAVARQLRAGVRRHRDTSGHDLCWYHPWLWDLLPDAPAAEVAVPPWPRFMRGCVAFRSSLDAELPDAPVHDAEFEGPGDPA